MKGLSSESYSAVASKHKASKGYEPRIESCRTVTFACVTDFCRVDGSCGDSCTIVPAIAETKYSGRGMGALRRTDSQCTMAACYQELFKCVKNIFDNSMSEYVRCLSLCDRANMTIAFTYRNKFLYKEYFGISWTAIPLMLSCGCTCSRRS